MSFIDWDNTGPLNWDYNPGSSSGFVGGPGTGSDFPEAPNDGKQYGRQSKSWTLIQNVIPEVEEAPEDGKAYARMDGEWVEASGNFVEAPQDGKQYARQDGAWSEVVSSASGALDGGSAVSTYLLPQIFDGGSAAN